MKTQEQYTSRLSQTIEKGKTIIEKWSLEIRKKIMIGMTILALTGVLDIQLPTVKDGKKDAKKERVDDTSYYTDPIL